MVQSKVRFRPLFLLMVALSQILLPTSTTGILSSCSATLTPESHCYIYEHNFWQTIGSSLLPTSPFGHKKTRTENEWKHPGRFICNINLTIMECQHLLKVQHSIYWLSLFHQIMSSKTSYSFLFLFLLMMIFERINCRRQFREKAANHKLCVDRLWGKRRGEFISSLVGESYLGMMREVSDVTICRFQLLYFTWLQLKSYF